MERILISLIAITLMIAGVQDLDPMFQEKFVTASTTNSPDSTKCHYKPVNNYSGLNSLRARIAGRKGSDKKTLADTLQLYVDSIWNSYPKLTPARISSIEDKIFSCEDPAEQIERGEEAPQVVTTPTYFFFKIGGAELTDPSQEINLDAMAARIKDQNLKVHLTGASDAQTGTDAVNMRVSQSRADAIAALLVARGVPPDSITTTAAGGISTFENPKANRHCKVEIFAP